MDREGKGCKQRVSQKEVLEAFLKRNSKKGMKVGDTKRN